MKQTVLIMTLAILLTACGTTQPGTDSPEGIGSGSGNWLGVSPVLPPVANPDPGETGHLVTSAIILIPISGAKHTQANLYQFSVKGALEFAKGIQPLLETDVAAKMRTGLELSLVVENFNIETGFYRKVVESAAPSILPPTNTEQAAEPRFYQCALSFLISHNEVGEFPRVEGFMLDGATMLTVEELNGIASANPEATLTAACTNGDDWAITF